MTQAADALPTNLFPTPETFSQYSAYDLLRAASHGRVGLDQRLIRAILDRDRDALRPDLIRFAAIAADEPLDLRVDLVEILRRVKTVEAIPFYLSILKEYGDDYPDELIEAVIEMGEPIVEPLLNLYEELGEEQGGPVAFLLAGLKIRDPRIYQLLVEEFEYDTGEGAFHLAIYGDLAAKPLLEKRIAEPGLDDELKFRLKQSLVEMDEAEAARAVVTEPEDIYELFDPKLGPDFDVLPLEDVAQLLASADPDYRAEALESLSPDDVDDPTVAPKVRSLAQSDPDPNVRGRAWEALSSLIPDDDSLLAELKTVLNDASLSPMERSGALVALSTATEGSEEMKDRAKELYEVVSERKHVLKAMWRSMDQSYASYMRFHLDDPDVEVCEQAIFGVGYLNIVSEAQRLEKYMQFEPLRVPALFNYALVVPGPKDRMGVKSILKKVDKVAQGLTSEETDVVKTALDRRLEMKGMKPVFETHRHIEPEPEDEE
jgi:hypothetical protein